MFLFGKKKDLSEVSCETLYGEIHKRRKQKEKEITEEYKTKINDATNSMVEEAAKMGIKVDRFDMQEFNRFMYDNWYERYDNWYENRILGTPSSNHLNSMIEYLYKMKPEWFYAVLIESRKNALERERDKKIADYCR